MSRGTSSPVILAESPELAIVEVLDDVLSVAANALIAANVELGSDDFERDLPDASVSACLADAVLTNVGALQSALERYRAYVLNADARRRCVPAPDF